MKTFIYTHTKEKQDVGWIGICQVYHMINNFPEFVGTVEYNSQSNPGVTTLITQLLVEKKKLPKTSLEKDGYVDWFKVDTKFKIILV